MLVSILLVPAAAHAYVGPGAGVAFVTSAFVLLVSFVLALLGLLLWPFRQLYRLFTRKRVPRPPRIRRAVVVGLDGLDPDLVQRWMDEGKLPTLRALAERGCFHKLATTCPAMSPVAWSSFATGVNPSKHGIFDFLTRDPRTYLPMLSSADVGPPRRQLALGRYRIPLGKPRVRLRRKSRPFWKILGDYRIPCSILRVPITFPPEPFDGTLLSAMCVPDLQGTQGSFTHYTSAAGAAPTEGGRQIEVTVKGDRVRSHLEGPESPIRADGKKLRVPFTVRLLPGEPARRRAELRIGGETVALRLGEYSDWIPVAFPMGLGLKLRGICRFRLLETAPAFRLYASPVNIDPERPVLPISHPFIFSVFLSKLLGRFATLGLAEDTWALNEGVLDEDAFLEQAWANHAEREAMFFQMLRRTPRGLVTCVFDGTDRIQHMFMRYLDEGHPAATPGAERHAGVIEDTYVRADALVRRVLDEVDADDPSTLVVVMSDHGFKSFRRGINLNAWLRREGYLVLEDGRASSDPWLRGVDWSRTRAYAIGLGGIFLNVKGREARGVVEPGEAHALADEIAAKLDGVTDPETGEVAIREVYPAHRVHRGPYADQAPDLIIGYAAGWRVSWDGARGVVTSTVFEDNTKAWSGDHCIDPRLVPGVLIASQPLAARDEGPAIADVAPTLLDLFGIPSPRYMDGRSLAA